MVSTDKDHELTQPLQLSLAGRVGRDESLLEQAVLQRTQLLLCIVVVTKQVFHTASTLRTAVSTALASASPHATTVSTHMDIAHGWRGLE